MMFTVHCALFTAHFGRAREPVTVNAASDFAPVS
jgi:hypothetical protein